MLKTLLHVCLKTFNDYYSLPASNYVYSLENNELGICKRLH